MSEGQTERLDAALGGKHRIERQLGEGGMATVYLAERRSTSTRLSGETTWAFTHTSRVAI